MALASCLVDTNILLRVASRSGAEHPMVDKALAQLAEQGTILHYTLQNMAEFWNVMTRPKFATDLNSRRSMRREKYGRSSRE